MEHPLFDLHARTLAIGHGAPLATVIDALLRMNGDSRRWKTPITLYLGVGSATELTVSASDALALSSVIRSMRSAIHPIGIGVLRGFEAIVLASGSRCHRHLLPDAVVCIGGIELAEFQMPNGTVGLNRHGPTLREQAKVLLAGNIRRFAQRTGLPTDFWDETRVLDAQSAVSVGLADHLVPLINPTFVPSPTREKKYEPSYPNL
jgi:hypothetical protein